jgi:ribosomal protein L16/L10AE
MPESLLHRADEFTPEERHAAEVLVGRALNAEESLSVRVYPAMPISIPDENRKEETWDRLSQFMDRLAERVMDVPETEVEAAIQEALDYVHQNQK